MKTTIKMTMVCMTLLSSLLSHAGSGGGNGGDAVVCPGRVQMLDTYELEKKHQVIFDESLTTIPQMVDEAILRIKRKDIDLGTSIAKRAQVFMNDILGYELNRELEQKNTEFTHESLVNVSDEGSASVPRDCRIEQLIIQELNPFREEKKFKVQADLWNQMTVKEKVAAIIHEAVYGYLLSADQNNSKATRYFNGVILRDGLATVGDRYYFELIRDLNFPFKTVSMYGVVFYWPNVSKYDENGNVMSISEGTFVKPIIKNIYVAGTEIEIGLINNERTWVNALVNSGSTGVRYADYNMKKIIPELGYYYEKMDSKLAKKFSVKTRDITLIGPNYKVEKTANDYILKDALKCTFKTELFSGAVFERRDQKVKCVPAYDIHLSEWSFE